jgi:magnesium and cobalt exporter, CNNM family
MPPAGWLLIAATALILVASWCAAAHDAMVRADPDGLETYGGLLTLIRVSAEVSAAVLVTLAFAHWLGGGWQVFLPAAGALLVATYVLIGVAPRPLGKQRAEKTAATAARLLRPLRRALGPLPVLLDKLTGVLPLGARGADHEFGGRPEVRSLVDYIEGQAEIEPGERDMVRSVFELGDTIVREVMVPRTDMVFIERDKTLDQALSLALRSGFSRIPVVGESIDDVVGIAYLKDVVAWEQEHPDADETLSERIEKVMRPATYVPDSKPVDELLRQMQSMRIHVAIVIDEYGGTAGLVTIEDILEEIVGEIADEYDTERAPVEWLAPGTARVTARLPVTELEELFGVTVDAEDVETVGGLLAHELGRVPIAGAEANVAGLRLTAENLAGRRNKLGTVLVQRVDAESELSRTGPCLRPSRPHYTHPGEQSAAWSRGREDHHAGPVDPGQDRLGRGRGGPRRDRADLHRGVGRAAVAAAVRAAPRGGDGRLQRRGTPRGRRPGQRLRPGPRGPSRGPRPWPGRPGLSRRPRRHPPRHRVRPAARRPPPRRSPGRSCGITRRNPPRIPHDNSRVPAAP